MLQYAYNTASFILFMDFGFLSNKFIIISNQPK